MAYTNSFDDLSDAILPVDWQSISAEEILRGVVISQNRVEAAVERLSKVELVRDDLYTQLRRVELWDDILSTSTDLAKAQAACALTHQRLAWTTTHRKLLLDGLKQHDNGVWWQAIGSLYWSTNIELKTLGEMLNCSVSKLPHLVSPLPIVCSYWKWNYEGVNLTPCGSIYTIKHRSHRPTGDTCRICPDCQKRLKSVKELLDKKKADEEKLRLVRENDKPRVNESIISINQACTDERLRQLQRMPYVEYLRTEEWLARREIKLNQANYKCQTCNSDSRLQVHHRTYERRGCELDEDLTVLCAGCHKLFHERSTLQKSSANRDVASSSDDELDKLLASL